MKGGQLSMDERILEQQPAQRCCSSSRSRSSNSRHLMRGFRSLQSGHLVSAIATPELGRRIPAAVR